MKERVVEDADPYGGRETDRVPPDLLRDHPTPGPGRAEHGEAGKNRDGGTSRTPSPTGRGRRRGAGSHPTTGGGGPPPLRGGLEERCGVGGGQRKGSSRTPTPTAGGKRTACRRICCDIIPRPYGGGIEGHRGRGPAHLIKNAARWAAFSFSQPLAVATSIRSVPQRNTQRQAEAPRHKSASCFGAQSPRSSFARARSEFLRRWCRRSSRRRHSQSSAPPVTPMPMPARRPWRGCCARP